MKIKMMAYFIVNSVILGIAITLFLNSCDENVAEFTLGDEYIESKTSIGFIDTFSVNLSTVLLDTLNTAGTGLLLVGYYKNNQFGTVESNSYFQVGIPDNYTENEIQDDDQFVSLELILTYDSYFYGDTTKPLGISVHQLTENIEPDDDDNITRQTTFTYDPQTIGSIVYTPHPHRNQDTLVVRISDEFGLKLLTRLKDDPDTFYDNEQFIDFFHGLVLVADNFYEGSVVGFSANEDNLKMVLTTKRTSLSSEEISYEFKLYDYTKQFNNIECDFTSTVFSSLSEQKYDLASKETNGQAFLQGISGLAIKVSIPSLGSLLLRERNIITKAQIIFSPVRGSYNSDDLPGSVSIYRLDKYNNIIGSITSSSLTIDDLYNEDTEYSFEITDYIIDELEDSYVDPQAGLLIKTVVMNTTFTSLILDDKYQKPKLKIYYLSY